MALSSGLISSTSSFLSAETPSFPSVPFLAARPFYLRVSRTPTLATASKQASSSTSKGELRGIMKPRRVSPEMQAVVGVPEISRTQVLKLIWAHIKENNLQDPENKRIIICDEKLKKIFKGRDRVGFLEVAGLISPHFL